MFQVLLFLPFRNIIIDLYGGVKFLIILTRSDPVCQPISVTVLIFNGVRVTRQVVRFILVLFYRNFQRVIFTTTSLVVVIFSVCTDFRGRDGTGKVKGHLRVLVLSNLYNRRLSFLCIVLV